MKNLFTFLLFAIIGILSSNAATFSSVSSGTWNAPATWNIVGSDADGIPDADDDVTIMSGHTVTLSSANYNYFKNLIVQNGATLSATSQSRLFAYGNVTFQGSLSGPMIFYATQNNVCNLSSVNPLTNIIMWGVYGTLNIASGTVINNSSATAYVYNGAGVNNSGVYNGNKILQGTGYWNDLTAQTGAFISVQTGNWDSPSTWTITAGVDADGMPDADDDVTVVSGHTVTLSSSSYNNFKNLIVQNGATLKANSQSKLFAYGNATFQGSLSGPMVFYATQNKVCNLSSVNPLTNMVMWGIYGTLNIASGTTITNFSSTITYLYNGATINNSGVYRGSLSMQGNGTWNNLSASTLTLTSASGLTSNASFSAQPNTVVYATSAGTICPTTYYNLTLNSGSTKSLTADLTVLNNLSFEAVANNRLDAQSHNITIGGNWTNNSTSSVLNQGTVNFNGSSAQSITGTNPSAFNNVTLSNSAGLTVNSPSITISDVLTVTNGNFNANGKVTLLSDASKTARLGTVGSGGSFSGSMTIQQYISARAAGYHDLSSPVQSTTIMDWDDELYMSGIGSYDGIAGPAGVDGSLGYYSVFTWDESTGNTAPNYGFDPVVGSSTALVNGASYEIFIGDDPNNYAGGTIDTKGVPQFGDKTVNLGYTASQGDYAGTNLLGNPFASAVDLSLCTKTNVTGNVAILDNSGSYADYGANPVIPAHQGFWVLASGSGASITFHETSKSNVTTTTFYRSMPNYGIKLIFHSPSSPYFNENTINFKSEASLNFDRDLDMLYFKSPNKTAPAIYMLTNSDAKLITNNINSDEDETTIPLAIFTPNDATYYIEPTILNIDSYNYVWIENTKTGKKYDLNSSVSILGESNKTNYDYVLRLSKTSNVSEISETVFDNDIMVFATENDVNLKSINSKHYINEVSIYDISGKLILQEKNITVDLGQVSKIDISNLAKGVYVVKVTDVLGHEKTQKILR